MKIEVKKAQSNFSDLSWGDVFRQDGVLFVRCQESPCGEYNVLNLEENRFDYCYGASIVQLEPTARLVID